MTVRKRRSTSTTPSPGDATTEPTNGAPMAARRSRRGPMLSFSVSVGPDRAMPESVLEELEAYAQKTGRTRSEIVTAAVLRYLSEAKRRAQ